VGHAVVDWCNFLREEAESYVQWHSQEIGGFDDNGQSITVEINESKFFN